MYDTDVHPAETIEDLIDQVFGEWAADPSLRARAHELLRRVQLRGEGKARGSLDAARSALTGERGRYTFVRELGRGGMGLVLRVRDLRLNRCVAMKVLRPDRSHRRGLQARFIEEAQTTAQLEHPGVVPVYDFGWLPDGRVYYTMQEVRGENLAIVIARLHAVSSSNAYGSTDGVSFRRLVDAFRLACEAVAYAHSRGVLHRDLKPENILMGQFGEVYVVDWGLARLLGSTASEAPVSLDLTEVTGDKGRIGETRVGAAIGTPGFMAPEQKQGRHEHMGPPADVFSLGVVLFQILTNRRCEPGDPGLTADAQQQILERPPHVQRTPEVLRRISLRAVQADPARRFADARELAHAVGRWLEGAERRDKALALVEKADSLRPQIAVRQHKRRELKLLADQWLARVPPERPVAEKRRAWAWEAAAEAEGRAIDRAEAEYVEMLGSALRRSPGLPEARERLARFYRAAHGRAEEDGDRLEAARMEARLRTLDDGRHADWLRGDGALVLTTAPTGAEVRICRYQERDRRLEAEEACSVETAPLHDRLLPMGSYLVHLRHPDCEPVRYPVWIPRCHRWSGRPAGADRPRPIHLPSRGSMAPDDCFVPAGWFRAGGDRLAHAAFPARWVWVDDFVMRRFPVTNFEYIQFLEDLMRLGQERRALELAPRRATQDHRLGPLLLARGEQAGFELRADGPDGDASLRTPVVMVPHEGAVAFAAWLAERTGVPWRLPHELEWEKAARGVDGRFYPWGNAFDPTWTCSRDSRPMAPAISPVDAYPTDESPYGVRGLAGNVREWCADGYARDISMSRDGNAHIGAPASGPGLRVVRGGCWSELGATGARVSRREGLPAALRAPWLGFRLVRSIIHTVR